MMEEHPLEYERLVADGPATDLDLDAQIPCSTIVVSGLTGLAVAGLIGWLLVISFRV